MAILIEQDKKSFNWFNAIIVIVVVAILFGVVYFVFFNNPQLIDVVVPGNLSNIKQLSQVQIDPTPVVSTLNKYFTNNYGSSLSIPTPGRPNPFLPY
ncbi:MAG: hypothetical protein ABSE68_02760 [Minisyncoccia bacterium]